MKNKNKRQVDLANFINFKSKKSPKTSLESLENLWIHVYKPKQKPCSFNSLLNGFILRKPQTNKTQTNKQKTQKNPQKTNKKTQKTKKKPKKPTLNVRRYFNLS